MEIVLLFNCLMWMQILYTNLDEFSIIEIQKMNITQHFFNTIKCFNVYALNVFLVKQIDSLQINSVVQLFYHYFLHNVEKLESGEIQEHYLEPFLFSSYVILYSVNIIAPNTTFYSLLKRYDDSSYKAHPLTSSPLYSQDMELTTDIPSKWMD